MKKTSAKPFFDPNRKFVPRTTRRSSDPLNPFEEFKQTRPNRDATFQNLVEIAANRFGMGRQLSSIRLCHEARKLLSEYFPKASDSQVRVVSFQEGSLSLAASSSTWTHQLTMKKHQLLQDLNQKIGADTVRKISVRTHSTP